MTSSAEEIAATEQSSIVHKSTVVIDYLDPPDLIPVKTFVLNSLSTKIKNNSMQYALIIKQFKERDDQDTLWKIIVSLSHFASLITQK